MKNIKFNNIWEDFNSKIGYFNATDKYEEIRMFRLYLESSNIILYNLKTKEQVSNKFGCSLYILN